jgi:hypothetical protein
MKNPLQNREHLWKRQKNSRENPAKDKMSKEVKLVQVGTGIGIRIPNMITKALGLRKGREVLLEPEEKGIRVVV